jgi:hypothetical protein
VGPASGRFALNSRMRQGTAESGSTCISLLLFRLDYPIHPLTGTLMSTAIAALIAILISEALYCGRTPGSCVPSTGVDRAP